MKFIVAVDRNWGIGYKGKLLARISEDQKNFRRTTMGHVVVLGRKTLEEFPGAAPLKGRTNIILSRDPKYRVDGAVIVHSIDELMKELEKYSGDEIFIIGGQTIYDALIPFCDEGIVTKIDREYEADAHITNLDEDKSWYIADERPGEDVSGTDFSFVTYRKKH